MGWLPTPRPRHPSAHLKRARPPLRKCDYMSKSRFCSAEMHDASKRRTSKSPYCTRRNDTSKARRFRGRAFTVFQSRDTPRPYWPVAERRSPRCGSALVGVTSKPSRVGLPVRQGRVIISDWHFHLRQVLVVEYLVLRDHLIDAEEKGRQRVDLVGSQRPLSTERHGPIDVIPHRRRKRCADRQELPPFPRVDTWSVLRFQLGSPASGTVRPMACRAPLAHKELRAFLGRAAARREFRSVRPDGDIQRAELLCGRRASDTISGRRLRQHGRSEEQSPVEQQTRNKSMRAHSARSHRWRSATPEWCCPARAPRPEAH